MSFKSELKQIYNDMTLTSFLKYFILIMIYVVILTSNLFAGFLVDNPLREHGVGKCLNKPNSEEYKGLPDKLHFRNERLNNIAEKIANSVLIICVSFMFLNFIPNNVRNLKIVFLFTTLAVVGFLIRVIAFSITVPPPPVKQHEEKYENIFVKIMKETDPRATVSDFMFSGHAFFIVLSLLFVWNYRKITPLYEFSSKSFHLIFLLIFIAAIIAIPSISMSRLHYSSDVVIGVSTAILLFLAKNNFAMKLDYHDLV